MIWHYFPIGMRFPVPDFSEETKRACWKIALRTVFASDAAQTGLYEACEPYDPVVQSPVYICIICYVGIKQSRAAGETLHTLDALMTRLCLNKPLVQANDLESFGPYPILGEIDANGTVCPNEAGAAFIPTETPEPMKPAEGFRILVAPDSVKNVCDAERLSRVIGTAAADRGFRVQRLPIADGGAGTVRSLIAGAGGRYETVSCEDLNGDPAKILVGVIPGPVAVIETEDVIGCSHNTGDIPSIGQRSSRALGLLIKKTLDLGYRKIWIGLGSALSDDLGLGALHVLGVRFTDADGEPVVPCSDTISKITAVDRSELDPRISQTELTLLYAHNDPLIGDGETNAASGLPQDTAAEQNEDGKCRIARLAALLGGDPNAPGSGAAGGLGCALTAIGGRLRKGADAVLDRIGIDTAIREADFVMTGTGCFDVQSIRQGNAPAALIERLSDADRPGCLLVGDPDIDQSILLREYPKLKGVVVCPVGTEPFDGIVHGAFERSVLPMIGKDVANDCKQ